MADQESTTSRPGRRSADEPRDTEPAVRHDIGTSAGRPRTEDHPAPDRTEPTGGHGPAGSGLVGGRGKLGSFQQPDAESGEGEDIGG